MYLPSLVTLYRIEGDVIAMFDVHAADLLGIQRWSAQSLKKKVCWSSGRGSLPSLDGHQYSSFSCKWKSSHSDHPGM